MTGPPRRLFCPAAEALGFDSGAISLGEGSPGREGKPPGLVSEPISPRGNVVYSAG